MLPSCGKRIEDIIIQVKTNAAVVIVFSYCTVFQKPDQLGKFLLAVCQEALCQD